MNRHMIIASLLLLAALPSMAQNTVIGRSDRYYYDFWYDECPSFQTHHTYMTFRYVAGSLDMPEDTSTYIIAQEHYTPAPLTIKGLATMIAIDPSESPRIALNGFFTDSTRTLPKAPEYMTLFQSGPPIPGVPEYYFPHQLTPLATVRWDTVTPRLMLLPRNSYATSVDDTAQFLRCYLYEAMLPTPITVDSTFYIMGTMNSNTMSDHPNEEGRLITTYNNYPTVYAFIFEWFEVVCKRCRTKMRLFRNSNFFPISEWVLMYDNYEESISAGPFLPVVND